MGKKMTYEDYFGTRDYPLIFTAQINHETTKEKETMKTKHTLENGTVLRVGETYINFLGVKVLVDNIQITVRLEKGMPKEKTEVNGIWENDSRRKPEAMYLDHDWTPYIEPKKKTLEGSTPYIQYRKFSNVINNGRELALQWWTDVPPSSDYVEYLTLGQAKELGLDLSMFNIKE